MPFKDLRHPPIQLGILQRCLEQAGIAARCHSLELEFMDLLYARSSSNGEKPISIEDYMQIATRDFIVQLGDWIFSEPSCGRDDDYLDCVRERGITNESIVLAQRMRKHVPEFLKSAADEILANRPRIVGFSTVFQQNLASLALAKILKSIEPDITIIFGGGNCDGPMGRALHESFPFIDLVVRGEGERAIVAIASDLLDGRPVRSIPGLCYRQHGRSMTLDAGIGPQVPLEEVPSPSYDEFFERLARSPLSAELSPEVAILFETSRGCWWGAKSHCTFCGLNGNLMAFRSKPAARAAEEIFDLAAKYKVLDFVAVDDIIDLRHVRELLPILASSGFDLTLFYETKSNLTKEQLTSFKHAGVDAIQPGIESLSTPILQLMRKGVSGLHNIRLLKWCRELNIDASWNLLYGFPLEPPEEYERMARLIPALVHLQPPILMPIQIERFSPYFDRPNELGLRLLGPEPYYQFLYDVDPRILWDLVYDFDHEYLDGRDPETYTANIAAAVRRWCDEADQSHSSLFYRRGPDFLIVSDRRPGFDAADYRFDGVEAFLYLGCDAGASIAALQQASIARGGPQIDTEELERYLQDLVDVGLMYREGNSYLSLAVASGNATSSRITGVKTTPPQRLAVA
jgi:ribosomal peptide maturation radical SAM protein 1